jgi:hypothetical protein
MYAVANIPSPLRRRYFSIAHHFPETGKLEIYYEVRGISCSGISVDMWRGKKLSVALSIIRPSG